MNSNNLVNVPEVHAHVNNEVNNNLNNYVEPAQNSLLFGLNIRNILGYILILLIVLAIIYFTVEKLQKK